MLIQFNLLFYENEFYTKYNILSYSNYFMSYIYESSFVHKINDTNIHNFPHGILQNGLFVCFLCLHIIHICYYGILFRICFGLQNLYQVKILNSNHQKIRCILNEQNKFLIDFIQKLLGMRLPLRRFIFFILCINSNNKKIFFFFTFFFFQFLFYIIFFFQLIFFFRCTYFFFSIFLFFFKFFCFIIFLYLSIFIYILNIKYFNYFFFFFLQANIFILIDVIQFLQYQDILFLI
ncbi:hypothetical protein IMG5_076170 [Ichthyophthirius multifiliis]|uniref:Transmembrane protein n=1 Tax=Ichthyophthirius multifiliis TaxID=5932 RepID=G0QQ86_ICHMU|nr:hypothetical protein IMG5_076170 [Ichthyophthirius multifiliis]EGR32587.1 hypothetical protein IMG5_076170 [Ichthyophthirius multifiliis]|eukprot:XP_004036573.1 hypothetical protein IMG5_076170 [Ichthyophthirius multifiliis]